MGNTGTKDQHVHYQLKDSAAKLSIRRNSGIDWARRRPIQVSQLTLTNTSNICSAPAPMRAMDLATHRARQTCLRRDRSMRHRINRRLAMPGRPRHFLARASPVNRSPSLKRARRPCRSFRPIMCFLPIARTPSTVALETGFFSHRSAERSTFCQSSRLVRRPFRKLDCLSGGRHHPA
jgi:hypothetical protein